MIRLQTYAGLSFLATLSIIYHAFRSRSQFYPATVYLSTSKISLMLLLNMGFVLMCISWQITKKIFLGSLREAEVERLNEQACREVMEILFAVTIFRQDFSVSFLAMVTALLLVKALHWLAQKRVEYIETTPSVPTLSHVRIVSFLGFLFLLDSLFFYYSAKYLIQTRHASVSLFFAFEYMILATTTVSTFVKYIFYISDMLMDGQWEKKAVYTFYLELIRDLLHLTMYLCFFFAIFVNYGVPLHLIRELYETFRNFKVRISDYIRYRKITSNMNNRFPDATPEELTLSDATCIICREEMTTAKKLNCGHLFHVHCLRSWLERQHTCPTCRAIVAPPDSGTNISGSRPYIHQQGTSPAGISLQTPAANGQVHNAHSQHEARIRAAAAAASIYEKSFVYPSANTLAWSAGYALTPQATGAQGSAVNTVYIANTHLLPEQLPNHPSGSHPGSVPSLAPGTDPNYEETFADAASLSTSQLKEQNLILRNQIQVLRNKLELLRKQRSGKTVAPSSSNDAGKAVESSSSKVLDNDQLKETQKS